jgi:hypothetical protein
MAMTDQSTRTLKLRMAYQNERRKLSHDNAVDTVAIRFNVPRQKVIDAVGDQKENE